MTTTPLVQTTILTQDNAKDFLSSLLIGPEEYATLGVCMTFVGPAGSGKTTLAASNSMSEYGGRTLLLDAEAGSKVVEGEKDVVPARISKWQEIDRLTDEFVAGKYPEFGGVILDNLCEMTKQNMSMLVGPTGHPEFKEWNQNTNAMRHLIRRWRTIAATRNINVYFIGWDGEDDSKIVVKRSIAFTPALQKEFPGLVDTIGMLDPIDGSPEERKINFTPSTRSITKFRKSKNDNARKIPYEIRYGIDKLPLPDILAVIKGNKPWPQTKYVAATPTRVGQAQPAAPA